MSYMIFVVSMVAATLLAFSIYIAWYINHSLTTCNIYQRNKMDIPHDDIFAKIENWCSKNRFLKRVQFALRVLCIVREPSYTKTGVFRIFNKSKLDIIEGIRLRNMPIGTAGKIDTSAHVIGRNRNELYLDPDAKLRETQQGNNSVIVGRLRNGEFVISCIKDNLPLFKNTWFAQGFRITKIKFGKFIRIEQAKKERLDRIAAKKRKIKSAQIAENVRRNINNFNREQRQRQNQYIPNKFDYINKFF